MKAQVRGGTVVPLPFLLLALLGPGCFGDPPAVPADACLPESSEGCPPRAAHLAFNDCAWLEASLIGDLARVQERLPPPYVVNELGPGTVLLGLQVLDCGSAVLDNETVLRGPIRAFFLWTPIRPPTEADRDDARVDDYPLEVFVSDPVLAARLDDLGLPARLAGIGAGLSRQPFTVDVSVQGARLYTTRLGELPVEEDNERVVLQRIHSMVGGADRPLNLTSSGFLPKSGPLAGALLHAGGEVAALAFPAINPVPLAGHVNRGRLLIDED